MDKIKTQDVWIAVDVKERLPEDSEVKFISTTLVDNFTGYFENGKWEGDFRGDEDYPEKVTYWLEKHNMVCLTKEDFQKVMIDFAEWFNNLTPTQKCTVHAPAGSGSGTGLYERSSSDLYDKFIKQYY